jgi:diaminohydroxyphosphoribosylaminopyrimidine deaminase / 5-amino-6-(5-phosphoribosylamino)uracil reductase
MFTGIISAIGSINNLNKNNKNILELKIVIYNDLFLEDIKIGNSISINGICLTVVSICGYILKFEVMQQTIQNTNIGKLIKGNYVNMEKAMSINSLLDGHLVMGHVDGTGIINNIIDNNDKSKLFYIKVINVKNYNKNWLVNKGSITVNGTSLTIAEKFDNEFMVSLIPYTQENTNFKYSKIGDLVNLEFDISIKNKIEKCLNVNIDNLVGTRIISNQQAMNIAIKLGEKGRLTSYPNPWVGCVIVKDNIIIGSGYHDKAGNPHAEINAINSAKNNNYDLENSILFSTLEPCSHYGRTPPCVNAIIKEKIKKVYICVTDTDDKVKGTGIEYLRKNNIDVELDFIKDQGYNSLKPYIISRKEKRPYIVLKVATSIDGKIALNNNKWISCSEARKDVHIIRNQSHAILVGVNTVIEDNPKLNVRLDQDIINKPLRIILDSKGKLNKKEYNIFNKDIGPTLIFTSNLCNIKTINFWTKNKINYKMININKGGLDLNQILKYLDKLQIIQLMVEGGGKVFTSFIKNNLFDELIQYQGDCIIGNNGIDFFSDNLFNKIHLKLKSSIKINNSIKNNYFK